jgi:ABC-type antimicrobial peptide transport system permease subunit
MALGARRAQVYRHVLAQALRPVGLGLLAGAGLTVAFARFLRGMLYDISPGDPFTLVLSGAVLGLATLAAGLWPAWRAAQLDPARVLRDD